MRFVVLSLAALAAVAGCKQRSERAGGLPPAEDWQAPPPLGGGGAAGRAADPHAGLDMAGDPHAGLDMAGDPHAGLAMGGDPHAGLDLADDPAMAGLRPPDPDRPIDPSKFLRGRITATPTTAPAIEKGAILFLSVKPIDPTSGDVIGGTLAVDRIDIGALPVEFALTEANSMVDNTLFAGDVIVTARIDRDGEARTREPGDVEGRVRARIPAGGLELVLDTIVR
jgi:hypothetical protein